MADSLPPSYCSEQPEPATTRLLPNMDSYTMCRVVGCGNEPVDEGLCDDHCNTVVALDDYAL